MIYGTAEALLRLGKMCPSSLRRRRRRQRRLFKDVVRAAELLGSGRLDTDVCVHEFD